MSWGASLRGQLSFVLGCHWLKPLTQIPGLGMLLPLSWACYGTRVKFLLKVGNFPPPLGFFPKISHGNIMQVEMPNLHIHIYKYTNKHIHVPVLTRVWVHRHGERTPAS